MLWALMEIDKRLPQKVEREYGHLMTNHATLFDIHNDIFQKVLLMLKELDEAEVNLGNLSDSLATTTLASQTAVYTARPNSRGRGGRASRGFFRQEPQGPRTRGFTRPPQTPQVASTRMFCKLCHIAGKSEWISRSHNMADCWALSRQDKQMLTQAQSFAIEAEEETNDPDQPLREILVPG